MNTGVCNACNSFYNIKHIIFVIIFMICMFRSYARLDSDLLDDKMIFAVFFGDVNYIYFHSTV